MWHSQRCYPLTPSIIDSSFREASTGVFGHVSGTFWPVHIEGRGREAYSYLCCVVHFSKNFTVRVRMMTVRHWDLATIPFNKLEVTCAPRSIGQHKSIVVCRPWTVIFGWAKNYSVLRYLRFSLVGCYMLSRRAGFIKAVITSSSGTVGSLDL
uniref:Uncharacterized protein n=1 Tax=Romanomermis culicivorax TaxID=13658 RepID=A0A915JL14_ROMCU